MKNQFLGVILKERMYRALIARELERDSNRGSILHWKKKIVDLNLDLF